MNIKNFYMKEKGYNTFYFVEGELKKSNRGYKMLVNLKYTEISKYQYYKQPKERRFVFSGTPENIHQISNKKFFEIMLEK